MRVRVSSKQKKTVSTQGKIWISRKKLNERLVWPMIWWEEGQSETYRGIRRSELMWCVEKDKSESVSQTSKLIRNLEIGYGFPPLPNQDRDRHFIPLITLEPTLTRFVIIVFHSLFYKLSQLLLHVTSPFLEMKNLRLRGLRLGQCLPDSKC